MMTLEKVKKQLLFDINYDIKCNRHDKYLEYEKHGVKFPHLKKGEIFDMMIVGWLKERCSKHLTYIRTNYDMDFSVWKSGKNIRLRIYDEFNRSDKTKFIEFTISPKSLLRENRLNNLLKSTQ